MNEHVFYQNKDTREILHSKQVKPHPRFGEYTVIESIRDGVIVMLYDAFKDQYKELVSPTDLIPSRAVRY